MVAGPGTVSRAAQISPSCSFVFEVGHRNITPEYLSCVRVLPGVGWARCCCKRFGILDCLVQKAIGLNLSFIPEGNEQRLVSEIRFGQM